MGPEEVCKKFGLNETKQIIDYLGMMGDAVDNIPVVLYLAIAFWLNIKHYMVARKHTLWDL